MTVKMKDMKRTGLFAEHKGVQPPTYTRLRVTIPAREALVACGATITQEDNGRFAVTLATSKKAVPPGIVATHISGAIGGLALRMDNDPEYPGEIGHAYWEQVDFTPCPKCGAALIWYEAGYVPGYRVCASKPHHHSLAQ
jgi:hypothetical protein